MLYHSVFNYFNLFVYTLLFRVETCWWPGIIWSNANLCHKAGRRGKQFFFFLFGNIIWALESTIFKYRMSYFVSNRLVNKYTNKLYTCTPWLVTKASWVCVLWPWTKLTSLKMQKKKHIKAKQNYNNGKTNKQKHRADILPSWQKKLGQKSIYYVYSHTKISSCEIKAEFVLAGKIDIHINWQVGYSPL